ncbi:MAG: ornithine cyclodeaminase family protein [Chloroflexi bacterium]|nr:ornithine cyclodeaminase family protein [Chloroflexota bacterium]
MVLFLTEEEVATLLPVADAIERLEEAFRALAAGEAQVLPRQRVRLPSASLQVMPAGHPVYGLGFKAYASTSAGTHFFLMLFDSRMAVPVALFQANRLGQIRTGAASGVATRYMARADAATVGIIGTGYQAETQLAAVAHVRQIKRVWCFSRTVAKRVAFAARMSQQLGIDVQAVSDAEQAVRHADIIITMTSAATPVVRGAWLRDGTHINAAGSNQASRTELDAEAVRRAERVVVDLLTQAHMECGDLIAAVQAGAFRWEQACDLSAVVAGHVAGRHTDQEITLFESQGIALEDIAVAHLVLTRARERGIGCEVAAD